MKPRRNIFSIWLAAFISCVSLHAEGMTLSPTNLVVVRVGDGVQTLTNTGNSFFLDEYTTAGNYVGTVSVPDSGASGLVLSGNSFVEGYLTRSLDNRYLCVAAYGTAVGGTNNLDTIDGTNVARVVAVFDTSGAFKRAIVTSNDFSGLAWRSAATDGTNNFWGAGSGGGTIYLGSAAPRAVVQNSKPNCRVVEVFNGSLFMASASIGGDNRTGIYKFSGLPKAATALPAAIIYTNTFTSPAGIGGFAVNPAGTIIYFADERAISGVQGGIQRWDLVAGTWSNSYNLTNGLGVFGTSHLAVDWSNSVPVLYATTSDSTNNFPIPNRLVKLIDAGQNSLFTTLASAGTNQIFRGVKFGLVPPLSPLLAATQPTNQTVVIFSNATFNVVVASGVPPFGYQWYFINTNLQAAALAVATNYSGFIIGINVTNGGFGYTTVPNVRVVGGGGNGAGGLATISNGMVIDVSITNAGVGYASQPTIQIDPPSGLISGQTNSSINLTSVTVSNAGSYFAVVSNNYGSVISAVARLYLTLPPLMPSYAQSGGSNLVGLFWASVPGLTYQVQYSTNLSSQTWLPLNNAIMASSNTTSLFDPSVTNSPKFYRVQLKQ